MKQHYYGILAILIALVSCQDHYEETKNIVAKEKQHTDYRISIESALANLESFMQDENTGTRNESKRFVKSVYPLHCNTRGTRSNNDNNDNLLYVANFENEQGYAILAADTRIDEKVIAITESGSLTQEEAYSAVDMLYQERPIFDPYPLDGPGFFTTEETGDEIFMNPNTVDFYNAEHDDYMIGNFDFTDDSDEGNMTRAGSQTTHSNSQITMCGLCLSYAREAVEKYKDDPNNPIVPLDPQGPQDPQEPSSPGCGDRTTISNTPWTITKIVSPMLSDMSKWHQHAPFNNLYPERRKFLFFGKKKRASAGCFPLAIAKILTFFKYPSLYTSNGYPIDWNALYSQPLSTSGEQSAAYLLYSIANGCSSLYFYNGTFTWPWNATGFLNSVGYTNAHSVDYDWNKAVEMLDNGAPLAIYGMPDVAFWNSHAWNIDGYKIRQRTKTIKKYSGGVLVSSTSKQEIVKMVHCCFGSKGVGDGYYVSGIFDSYEPSVEFDDKVPDDRIHYNTILHLVVYNKP